MKSVRRRDRVFKLGALALLACVFSGCSVLSTGCRWMRSTSQFKPLAADARIRYETGAEAPAAGAQACLAEAIATVEKAQARPFPKPVAIYVCATWPTFESYTGQDKAAGAVTGGRLFLSPKLLESPERLCKVLTHELSHLQLDQQRGSVHPFANLPSWFKEGLAALVSGGGGAEGVSDAEAMQAIHAGRSFQPVGEESWFARKMTATSYGLETHLFYKEAALFLGYLQTMDAEKFKGVLLDLEDGKSLDQAVQGHYAKSMQALFTDFTATGVR